MWFELVQSPDNTLLVLNQFVAEQTSALPQGHTNGYWRQIAGMEVQHALIINISLHYLQRSTD